jgi:hypothetical protein
MIKASNKPVIELTYHSIIKAIDDKYVTNIILTGKKN